MLLLTTLYIINIFSLFNYSRDDSMEQHETPLSTKPNWEGIQ